MYRVKISDRESLHSYNIFSYFCFGSSIPDSFLVAIKLWHVDVFIWSLQLVTLRFFFKYKCIRSTPHIWSQIRIFRVTIIYVNYLSFFGFFHLLLCLNAKHLDDSYCMKMSYRLNFLLLEVLSLSWLET